MSLETGTFVTDLVSSNPPGTDDKKEGDDHLRLIKSVLKATFPNASRAIYFDQVPAIKASNYAVLATDQNALIRVVPVRKVRLTAKPRLRAASSLKEYGEDIRRVAGQPERASSMPPPASPGGI